VKRDLYSYKLIDSEASGRRKQMVLHLFDAIAPTYDLLNRVLSFGIDQVWRRAAAEALSPLHGKRILDLCCGTGDLTAVLRKKGARPVSLDFSPNMIRRGIKKKAIDSRATVSDASFLPFKDNAFNAAAIAFGARNIPDLTRFLKETSRVLIPGGNLVILELVRPETRLIKPIYRIYLNHVLPFIGKMISRNGWAYAYLAQTIATFIDPETLIHMMKQNGFEHIRCFRLTAGIAALISGTNQKEARAK
jgi:demethylmenaquinone methyltransferase / 2-methoxy-6-polyprenyl-1,4-benzoquinol methylase